MVLAVTDSTPTPVLGLVRPQERCLVLAEQLDAKARDLRIGVDLTERDSAAVASRLRDRAARCTRAALSARILERAFRELPEAPDAGLEDRRNALALRLADLEEGAREMLG